MVELNFILIMNVSAGVKEGENGEGCIPDPFKNILKSKILSGF